MNSLVVASVVLATTVGSMLIGIFLRSVLPDPHLNGDSRAAIRMGTGLIGTVTALVLGLLTASAKSSYDAQCSTLQQMSANVAMLDRQMIHYGPEAGETRFLLRKTVTSLVENMWPADRYQPAGLEDSDFAVNSFALLDGIRNLPAKSESQQIIKSQALQISTELGRAYWQLQRWQGTAIPTPFLVVLNLWLGVLFLDFGLFTPWNTTVLAMLFACAVSVASAIFLIVELDQPFAGLVRISSQPLKNALDLIGR